MNWRLKVATYRLRPDETIRGLDRPRPIFERTREAFAGWTVWKFRIASVLIVVRFWKGV